MSSELDPKAANGQPPAKRRAKVGKPQPIAQFARFFKGYSLGLSLIVAAVPLGIAQWSLVPMFESGKYSLTIITSAASYLLVGFIFSQRQSIARMYFPGLRRGQDKGKGTAVARVGDLRKSRLFSLLIPSVLACLSILLFFLYLYAVSAAIQEAAYRYSTELPQVTEQAALMRMRLEPGLASKVIPARLPFGGGTQVLIFNEEKVVSGKKLPEYTVQFPDEAGVRALLTGVPSESIPYVRWQAGLFLWAFLCAVAAFVLMGMKDYLQGELGLTDRDLILNPTVGTIVKRFWVEEVPGAYGQMEYCPNDIDFKPIFDGYYCIWHRERLLPGEFDDKSPGLVKSWQHNSVENNIPVLKHCPFQSPLSESMLGRLLDEGGAKEFQRAVVGTTPQQTRATPAEKGGLRSLTGRMAETAPAVTSNN